MVTVDFGLSSGDTILYGGDSTVHGIGALRTYGGPPYYVRNALRRRYGSKGYGALRPHEGTYTGAWVQATAFDLWDKWFTRRSLLGGNDNFQKGTTASDIFLWRVPPGMNITSFRILVCDAASSSNFSYRKDGGAWTNVSKSWVQNNTISYITIASGFEETIEVRCANAAGTGVTTYLGHIEVFEGAGSGLTVHSFGVPSSASTNMVRNTFGEWQAIWNLLDPKVGILQFTNDLQTWDPVAYTTRMESVTNLILANGGKYILVNFYEQTGPNRDTAEQVEYRQINKDICASDGMPCVDMFDIVGNYASAFAAGLMSDDVHGTDKGYRLVGNEVTRALVASEVLTGA